MEPRCGTPHSYQQMLGVWYASAHGTKDLASLWHSIPARAMCPFCAANTSPSCGNTGGSNKAGSQTRALAHSKPQSVRCHTVCRHTTRWSEYIVALNGRSSTL